MNSIRPFTNLDPGLVRREAQTRYDDYMHGSRKTVGIVLPDVTLATMGTNHEERQEAYERLAAKWPRRSAKLITSVAHELLFQEVCKLNHDTYMRKYTEGLDTNELSGFVYISGLGRNACRFSMVEASGATPISATADLYNVNAFEIVGRLNAGVRCVIDPDFGFGDIVGPTPEVFGIDHDNPSLAESSMELWADFADALNQHTPLSS